VRLSAFPEGAPVLGLAQGVPATLLPGDLQVSVDWYHITINDGIGRWHAMSAVEHCFDPAYNPSFNKRNVYCSFFTRDADTGTIYAHILDCNIPRWKSLLNLSQGVDNLFDKAPPTFPRWQQANTDPPQYDVLGRRYDLRLQYRFQ
jgi:hypothetical protein